MLSRRHILAGAAVLAAPSFARAQAGWPGERPIDVIVPYPPGGGVDTMARLVMPHVMKHLGRNARSVVSNRGGAGGQVGFEYGFNAAPDGYTLCAVTLPAISTFPLERSVRYRPLDFSFLANVVDDPNTIYVAANSPLRTLADLVAAAKARPGELSYGTTGIGSDDHILMLNFEAIAGIPEMTHVPFAGAAPLMTQILGGHLPLGVANMAEIYAGLREGQLRSLGQAAEQRWQATPDVPTFREQGFDLVGGSARGIVGPPGLPEPIRTALESAFTAALADPEFLREAERVGLPLRPAVGTAYRAMAASTDEQVKALWQRRPWNR
ncbi:Bug family tripartite tricarboxylate transporter substrate binding protein [Plastoroseomonas hellenica]|uniref:Bug family tripartite tricarboxylate transporter substrate binding protein n=1 Tax=Plastoroseomonas hellenica TaxID=2687306 RepID=UPI001BAE5012|nr:tripartite tricarboxylate transporter substrate binding protein [Plastoroseomonas hellenica]MBR0643015.1 tripartite tricarboxylate transporter substrate binding protein [Plastoroseomonas hellenica]